MVLAYNYVYLNQIINQKTTNMKKLISLISLLAFAVSIFAQSSAGLAETSVLTDKRDGKIYKIASIGSQTWMIENLAYKTSDYYSGESDPSMTFAERVKYSRSRGCYAYDYDESYVKDHGYLYNWETAKQVCPDGWRLPTKDDFTKLMDNYGGDERKAYPELIVGGNSGFSGTFDGKRGKDLAFNTMDRCGYYWSSTEYNEEEAYLLYFSAFNSVGLADFEKVSGYSVRCIKE